MVRFSKISVWVFCVLLAAGLGCEDKKQKGGVPWSSLEEITKPTKKQKMRVLEPIVVADIDVPQKRPMVGEDGVDEFGYPKEVVDKIGILALLRNREYAKLTEYIESFQNEFEADFKKEYWPHQAIESFSTADPRIEPLLDEWVERHPESFAPWAARGTHLNEVGWEYRGGAFANTTSEEQFNKMREYHQRALTDFKKALELRPKAINVYQNMMVIYRNDDNDDLQQAAYNKARAACPNCYLPPLWHIWDLQPRWGGSLEKMKQFADEITKNKTANPKLTLIPGFVPYEKCKILRSEKKYKEALEACNQALTYGESWWFYYVRGDVKKRMKKYSEAVADFERALEIAPQSSNVLGKYARSLCATELARWKDAGEALLTLLRLNPVEQRMRQFRTRMKNKLLYEATRLYENGKKEEVVSYYELASKLFPDNKEATDRLNRIRAGEDPRDEAEKLVAELVPRSYKEPNNINVYIELDKQLFKKHRLKEIVGHWNRFIAANPNAGRAYLERMGTYHHLRNRANALKDATKACELGMKKACRHAERMKRKAK